MRQSESTDSHTRHRVTEPASLCVLGGGWEISAAYLSHRPQVRTACCARAEASRCCFISRFGATTSELMLLKLTASCRSSGGDAAAAAAAFRWKRRSESIFHQSHKSAARTGGEKTRPKSPRQTHLFLKTHTKQLLHPPWAPQSHVSCARKSQLITQTLVTFSVSLKLSDCLISDFFYYYYFSCLRAKRTGFI